MVLIFSHIMVGAIVGAELFGYWVEEQYEKYVESQQEKTYGRKKDNSSR